jgi:UV DNA damage endonuclease
MKRKVIIEDPLRYGRINLGLCCINTVLRKDNIFCSRGMIRNTFTVERAQKSALANIQDAITMMKWNHEHNIHVFRLSSDIFPHFTDPETESYSIDFANDLLAKAGEAAVQYNQRITMHPGQFNQVGTPTRDVFEKTVADLSHHADILDRMNTDPRTSILCIHGGGLYGNKEETHHRWIKQFDELPTKVKSRLALENCEKCYCVGDCLCIADECKIPVILDSHHETCYRQLHPTEKVDKVEDLLSHVIDTWKQTPLFHISEQRPDARVGAHSDFIEKIPLYMLNMPIDHNSNVDIEVEAKMKEQSIFHLYKKYPEIF